MLVGYLVMQHHTLVVHIVQEEILIEILLCTRPCRRCLADLILDHGIQFLALTLEHRRADVLGTGEEAGRLKAKGLARQPVRIATYLLIHS